MTDPHALFLLLQANLPKGYWLKKGAYNAHVSIQKVGVTKPLRVIRLREIQAWRDPVKTLHHVIAHAERIREHA